jgi:hypothetical protein
MPRVAGAGNTDDWRIIHRGARRYAETIPAMTLAVVRECRVYLSTPTQADPRPVFLYLLSSNDARIWRSKAQRWVRENSVLIFWIVL